MAHAQALLGQDHDADIVFDSFDCTRGWSAQQDAPSAQLTGWRRRRWGHAQLENLQDQTKAESSGEPAGGVGAGHLQMAEWTCRISVP
jgi:hypothetical protein